MKKMLNVRSRDLKFILSVALSFSLTSLLSRRYDITCYHTEMLYDIQQYYDSKWRTSLLQELETLGISIHHLDYLNDSGELQNLVDNLKQQFMEEIREMEEQGLFINLGGG